MYKKCAVILMIGGFLMGSSVFAIDCSDLDTTRQKLEKKQEELLKAKPKGIPQLVDSLKYQLEVYTHLQKYELCKKQEA